MAVLVLVDGASNSIYHTPMFQNVIVVFQDFCSSRRHLSSFESKQGSQQLIPSFPVYHHHIGVYHALSSLYDYITNNYCS